MSAGFAGALALAATALGLRGTGHSGTVTGLLLSARWAYGFFWPAYVAAPLATLFGPALQPLARRARQLGLAFASAMLVHASLVAWLYYSSPRPPLPLSSAVFFGVGLVLVYVLALLSIPALARRLRPTLLRWLFTLGMEYIALAFLSDFLHNPFDRGLEHLLAYLPFVTLSLCGVLLRLIHYGSKLSRWVEDARAPRSAHPTGK